jgi:hypothetical protein
MRAVRDNLESVTLSLQAHDKTDHLHFHTAEVHASKSNKKKTVANGAWTAH